MRGDFVFARRRAATRDRLLRARRRGIALCCWGSLLAAACGGTPPDQTPSDASPPIEDASVTPPDGGGPDAGSPRLVIDLSFPPVRTNPIPNSEISQLEFTIQHMDRLGSKRLRMDDDWNRHGGDGPLTFTVMRNRLNQLRAAGKETFVTLRPAGPNSACDEQDEDLCVFVDNDAFEQFVLAYVDALGDGISILQFGNEMLDEAFYPGSPEQYVASELAFARAVRAGAPNLPIAIGGFSTGTLRRYAACRRRKTFTLRYRDQVYATRSALDAFCSATWIGVENDGVETIIQNAEYDIIDLHLYDDPENWPLLLEAISEVAPPGTRFVVSELGGPNAAWDPEASDPQHQADEVARYLTAIASMEQIEQAYFFKLVERGDVSVHTYSGLLEANTLDPKPGYFVVQAFNHGQL